VPTKPPINGKGSPTSDTDPFHIEKSEWLSLSSSTKEKINMMKKQLRDSRPSSNNIHLFCSLDDTQPGQSPTPVDIQTSEEPDPFSDTMRHFMIRAHRKLVTSVTRVRLPSNFHFLEHKATPVYGRLISDSRADTGALSDTYAFITSTHDTQVTVDGCHPHTSKTYNLCDGIVAIDINNSTYLLGMRGVPLIPNSIGMLLSELQVRAYGIEIDSTPRIFGGKGHIVINGNIRIPLHLEQGLMTCPIRKPNLQEVKSLPVYWLTNNEVWDPSYYDEIHKSTDIVPQGYGCTRGIINLSKSSTKVPDATLLSKFFLYRPVDVIKHTLSCTTRLATSIDELNMRCHYKSRIPMLNRPRIHETYATDTWFANTRAIGGYTCAQIFYGTKSRFIVLYPMKREGNGPQILEDFIRDHGAPFTIRSDNSQMQSSTLWSSICRKYNIAQAYTEPNHPHQNPAERYIGHVIGLVSTIFDRTGAPDKLWAICAIFVVYILNRMAHPLLENQTPFEVRHG